MTDKVVATAKVKVTLEVDAASWDPKSSCQYLLGVASREAVQQVLM